MFDKIFINIFGYTFKNETNELGGYAILKNKKIILAMDIGSSPNKNFSIDYQYGALSFEIFSNIEKEFSVEVYILEASIKLSKI